MFDIFQPYFGVYASAMLLDGLGHRELHDYK